MAGIVGKICGFATKATTGVVNVSRSVLVGPSLMHSFAFGGVASAVFVAAKWDLRTTRTLFFDSETVPHESRRRYKEKQELFMEEQAESSRLGELAELAAEYNPVDARMPFQSLPDAYRL
eukprot:GDKH01029008.1.p1 GENE.GDKH01029008.1~~GDKH01029008.1.p1  ORF type:complete len:120 (+),score=14.15 GDKH01029008.1:168-527(+)